MVPRFVEENILGVAMLPYVEHHSLGRRDVGTCKMNVGWSISLIHGTYGVIGCNFLYDVGRYVNWDYLNRQLLLLEPCSLWFRAKHSSGPDRG